MVVLLSASKTFQCGGRFKPKISAVLFAAVVSYFQVIFW
jgi:hypothetical protein